MADGDREQKDLEQEKIEKRGWPTDEPCSGCGRARGHGPDCPNR
jgi:hypothetical protein